MDSLRAQRALGIVSKSSMDGVAAAVISTDGVDVFADGAAFEAPYEDDLRDRLRHFQKHYAEYDAVAKQTLDNELARFFAGIVREMQETYDETIDIVGLDGPVAAHKPAEKLIVQLGNGQQLADEIHIKTVSRFMQADMLAGGQGAPLSAVYHQALAGRQEKPFAIVDIGGIASLTWLGSNGEMLAFDIAPGCNAINDWTLKHGGQHADYNGKLAALGQVQTAVLSQLMRHKFLAKMPPKAADKETFRDKLEHLEGLSLNDGAATATAFVAEAIAYSMALYVPEMPKVLAVCGNGAENPTLLRFLRQRFENTEVKAASEFGWNAVAAEAQAFAFLAVRRSNFMPATYPFTTGVLQPCICGEIFEPQK